MADNRPPSSCTDPGFPNISGTPTPASGISDTPRCNVTNAGIRNITTSRDQIAKEMDGEFLTSDVATFMTSYLPFSPSDEDVENCVKNLMDPLSVPKANWNNIVIGKQRLSNRAPTKPEEPVMQYLDGQLRFSAYPAALTKDDGSEQNVFKYLDHIAAAVGECVLDGRKRNGYHYTQCPSKRIESAVAGSNNMIDACITSDGEGMFTTSGIAVPIEYKLHSRDRHDNNKKVVAANVQIMNADPRRMFTFGITIESDQVTLWYHSRSHSAVCKRFSFVENPKLFIKVIMSFLFATDLELGYDSKVTLYQGGATEQYTYEIPEMDAPNGRRFYRTIKPIAEYRTNNITGRMSRVWLVTEVNDPSDPNPIGNVKNCILKDVWLESKAETELQLRAHIFKDIEDAFTEKKDTRKEDADARTTNTEDARLVDDAEKLDTDTMALKAKLAQLVKDKDYEKFFLTPLCDFVGECSKATAPGARRTVGLFVNSEQMLVKAPNLGKSQVTRSTVGTSQPLPSQTSEGHVHREYAPRKQYRVVFEEVCTTVGDLETLGEVVNVLRHVLIPLQLMFCAGWVHRDISSGNIMAHRMPGLCQWQAKLADLEYAKKYPPPNGRASVDPKIGTPFFMPVEIMMQRLFAQQHAQVDSDSLRESILAKRKSILAKRENLSAGNKVGNVIHSPQHDLESLWWLFLWSITARVNNVQSREFVKKIFVNNSDDSRSRESCLQMPAPFEDYLDERLHADFPACIEVTRNILFYNYLQCPIDQPQSLQSIACAHKVFKREFTLLHEGSNEDWRAMLLKVDGEKPTATAKDFIRETSNFQKPSCKRPRRLHDADEYDSEKISPTGKRKLRAC